MAQTDSNSPLPPGRGGSKGTGTTRPATDPRPPGNRPSHDFPPIPDAIRPLPGASAATVPLAVAGPTPPPRDGIGHHELRQALEISALREDLERLLDTIDDLADNIETAVEQVRRQVAPLSAEELADPDVMAPLLQFAVSTLIAIRDRARAIDTRTGVADDAARPQWDAGVRDDAPPTPDTPARTTPPAPQTAPTPPRDMPQPLPLPPPSPPSRGRPVPPPPRPLTPQNPLDLMPFAPVGGRPPEPPPLPPAAAQPPPRHAKPAGSPSPLGPTPARTGGTVDWLSPAKR